MTNPCGERPLLPYEPCGLGSSNLGRFAAGDGPDPARSGTAIRGAVVLDNVIEANCNPLAGIVAVTRRTRKIVRGATPL